MTQQSLRPLARTKQLLKFLTDCFLIYGFFNNLTANLHCFPTIAAGAVYNIKAVSCSSFAEVCFVHIQLLKNILQVYLSFRIIWNTSIKK